jgi:PAS domain S-box-containing protein
MGIMADSQGAEPLRVHCILHDGVVTFVSALAEQVSGLTPERFQGRAWHDIVHPDDREPLLRFSEPGWEGLIDATFRMQDADGAWTWRRAEGVRTIDAEGRPSSIITLQKIEPPR